MITLYFGNVSKRKNSTFVPALTQSVQAVLKDGTSENNPTFLISAQSFSANYCKWDNRYYFIDDIIYERNNLYNVKCVLDVLATYKANILGTTAFVAYDTTENAELTDNRISIETSKTLFTNSQKFNKIGSGEIILVNVVGEDSTGCFAMYEGSAKQLIKNTTFEAWLNSPAGLPYPEMSSLTDIVDVLKVGVDNFISSIRQLIATGKASDCIKSAFLLPIDLAHIAGVGEIVYLGKYDTAVLGRNVSATTILTDDLNINIPWPTGVNDWRRNAPYTRLYLYLPYIGCVEIPTSEIIDDTQITILTSISPASGDTVFTILSGNRKIMQFTTNIASPYAIGNSNITASQMANTFTTGVASAIGALATGGATAILSGTMGIAGITNNLQSMPQSIGNGIGSASLGLSQSATLFTVFHDTNVAPDSVTATIGTPAMAVKSLGNLSGYVECRNASVSAPAEAIILDQINNLLNNGIFIE